MTHKPIKFSNISFVLPHKSCFIDFNETILYGERIALMGKNGSGKSTLLKMLLHQVEPTAGTVLVPDDVRLGYVAQVHEEIPMVSGGQQFNRMFTKALAPDPNFLILDEPTNHLDKKNRASLLRSLRAFPHTLLVCSHDAEVLAQDFDKIYYIDDGEIHVFTGSYEALLKETSDRSNALEGEIHIINKMTKEAHKSLMREQGRAKNSRLKGEKSVEHRKWPTIVSKAKAKRAEATAGRKKSSLQNKKTELSLRLSGLRRAEVIRPKFHFESGVLRGALVSIQQGAVGYSSLVLNDINLALAFGDRIAIAGDNGSGKSTLLKAMLGDSGITRTGHWHMPKPDDIGYLDQNYGNLHKASSALDMMSQVRPDWNHQELRDHLNSFLFRKNEEVHTKIGLLSGGERLRLSLCLIAARTPRLLMLDEVTNNVDMATKEHLIQALSVFAGGLVVISHDEDFLKQLHIQQVFITEGGTLNSRAQARL